MANYPTPHINAKPGDFGKTVLMPGDPLRSKFIAENFLENAVLVNNVRGIHGYTGTYHGVKISVMASGMGMPSIGIYSWELYTVFGVENILRIGSTGAMQENINLRDIVIGQGACTDSNWAGQYHLPGTFAPIADYHMLETCVETAKELGLPYHVGNILSSDRFYGDDGDMTGGWIGNQAWKKMGVMAVEMEAAPRPARRCPQRDCPRRQCQNPRPFRRIPRRRFRKAPLPARLFERGIYRSRESPAFLRLLRQFPGRRCHTGG